MIEIPAALARPHGGDNAHAMGARFAETFELSGLRASDSVLDIGCGPGRMAIAIGERFNWSCDYLGFDIRRRDIEFCEEAITAPHPNFRFVHIDVFNQHYNQSGTLNPIELAFPAPDRSVDFCFATSVFTHMFRDETAHYLREAGRVVKPGGRLFSTWFAIDNSAAAAIGLGVARFQFPFRRADGTRIQREDAPADVVAHDLEAIRAMHADAGFTDVIFHRGGWPRVTKKGTGRHSQDAVTAVRV